MLLAPTRYIESVHGCIGTDIEAVELPLAKVHALDGEVPLVNLNRKLYISIQAALCKHRATNLRASSRASLGKKKEAAPPSPPIPGQETCC